jgi:hypothetical protein
MSSESHRKNKERIKLARDIETRGFEMSPCSHCEREGRRCVVDSEQSSRCAECVRRKRSCDGLTDGWDKNVPRENDWVAIERQENALEELEERAAAQAQEAMARVARLRKQRRFLRKRKIEMARRGLRFLDDLDAAEAKETEREEAQDREAPAPVSDVLDLPGVLGLDDFDPDPAFWESLGFVGGTPQASQGS